MPSETDPYKGQDPFTQIYAALWGLLEGSGELTAQVKVANRIKVAGSQDADTWKKTVQAGDLPELYLGPAGGGLKQMSSSSYGGTLRFMLAVTTGHMQTDLALNPVLWACIRALATRRGDLDLGYVKAVRLVDFLLQPENLAAQMGEQQRGTRGWAGLLSIEVDVMFNMEADTKRPRTATA